MAANAGDVSAGSGATAAPKVTTASSGKGDGRDGVGKGGSATGNTGSNAAGLLQPPAAAVVVNADIGGAVSVATGLAIEDGKSRGTASLTLGSQQNAQNSHDTGAGHATGAKSQAGDATAASTANDSASGSTVQSAGTPTTADLLQQAQTQATAAASSAKEPTSTGGTTRATSIIGVTMAAAQSASLAQAATGAKATEIPNFGLTAASGSATSSSATAAAASGGVPLSGLAVTIAARGRAGSKQFDIRLDPPELGAINVRLGIDRSGQVTSHVTVERADTLQLLQSQQPQLEQALQQAGLKTAANGMQFTLQNQSFAGQNGGGNNGANQQNSPRLVIADPEVAPIGKAQAYSRVSVSSGIDIRV